jgi:glutamate 5-kinase
MKTKLEAVRKVLSAGISAHILDGRKPGQLHAALQGGDVGTAFAVRHHPLKP